MIRPIRWHLLVIMLGLSLFGLLATMLTHGSALHRLDAACAPVLHDFAQDRPTLRRITIIITDLGAGLPLWYVGCACSLMLLLRREWIAALVWGVAAYTSRPIAPWLKGQFQRPRPSYVDWADFSFPSGHALGSAVIYGLLGFLLLRIWQGSRARWPIASLPFLFAILVALSRPLLGVHYVSDVVAGFSLGIAWATFFVAIEKVSTRAKVE